MLCQITLYTDCSAGIDSFVSVKLCVAVSERMILRMLLMEVVAGMQQTCASQGQGCAREENTLQCHQKISFHAGGACCAATGVRRRETQKADPVEPGHAELASSDSEENGIALGNAPGARGSPLLLA